MRTNGYDEKQHVGLRIPLSLGNPREGFDKNNKFCLIYDVIFNPDSITKAKTEPVIRQMLCELSMSRISEKFHKILDVNCTFPRMRYKSSDGSKKCEIQRIKAKKAPVIEIVDKEQKEEENKFMKNTIKKNIVESDIKRVAKIPEWTLFVENTIDNENIKFEYNGLNATYKLTKNFIFEVKLEMLITGRGIKFLASEEAMHIKVTNL